MSVTYGFYNSRYGDRKYNARQMSSIFDGIIRDGVFAYVGSQLMVSPGSGWTVNVGTGRAWFDHTWTLNDAVLPLTLAPADVTRGRIDAVVLEVDAREAVRANSIKIIQGTPSETPSNPALQRSGGVTQYPLAYISVAGGSTSIRQADITNCVGTSECPFVTAPLESPNLDALIAQQRDAWTFLMESTQQNTYREFADWFGSAKQSWTQQMQDWFDSFVEDSDSELAELLRIALASHRALRVYNNGEIPTASGAILTFREGQNPYSTSYFYPATNMQQGDFVIGTNGYIGEITRIDEEIGGAVPRNMDITAKGISIVPAATALTAADISTRLQFGGEQYDDVQEALEALADAIGSGSSSSGAVSSVNGKTGAVTLDAGDIDVNFTLDAQNANVEEALNDIGDAVTALRASVPAAPVRNTRVHSINHRGYNTEAPENTLPAFLLSKARGFAMVETDVCFTSDGVAVLLHDDTINRTARNSDGTALSSTVRISDITYAQALEYDFGIWKDAKYAGTRIPTLEEFLQLCKDNALHPYIEIKNSGVVNGQVTAEMTALLRDSAVAVAKDMDMLGRITWISFSAPILAKLAELDAVSRLGYIVSQGNNGGITDTVIQEVRAIDPTLKRVFIDSSSYTAAEISRCKAAEIPLEIWTLDDWTGVSLDPYITGVTSNYRIAGEVLQNNDSRVRDASHVVIPWTRANGLSSSNGSDSSTGDYRMLLMDFLPVRKNEVYQFHSRVSESDFLSTSDHKMVTVVAYYDEKQRFLRGTYSSLSNPNVVNGYCVRKDAISITGTNADARYIRISFRSMNTASYGLLRVRDANGELTPSLERLLFERLESTDAQAATLAAQLTPMTGATAQAAGTAGLVPAPASGDNGLFLRGDATWQRVNAYDVNFSSVNFNADDVHDALEELYGAFQDTITAVNTALASVVGGGSNG